MKGKGQWVLLSLRLALGWLFFYAGITKVFNPDWSAAGYLNNAKTFAGFYQYLASPALLPAVNFLNEWGLTLIGLSLILGFGVKISSVLGMALMVLYYFPVLDFPYPNPHSLIVDEHFIYFFSLWLLRDLKAGEIWGLDKLLFKK